MISDPRFPQIAQVLQPAHLQPIVERHLFRDAPIRECVIGEKRYAPGKRFILTCRVLMNTPDAGAAAERILGIRLIPAGEPPAGENCPDQIYLPEIHGTAWTFPYDPLLPGLPRLLDQDFLAAYLPGLLADLGHKPRGGTLTVEPEVLHYLPECSCMIRYRIAFTNAATDEEIKLTVYGKVYGDRSGIETFRIMHELGDQFGSGARPLRFDDSLDTLWQAHVDGSPVQWTDLVADEGKQFIARLGQTVAELHGAALNAAVGFGETEIEQQLRATVKAAQRFDPEAAVRITAVVDRLLTARGNARWPNVPTTPLHRDLKLGNFLMNDTAARLIDLDCVCLGDPLTDIGGLAASIAMNGLRAGAAPAAIYPVIERLWAGYAAAVGWNVGTLQSHWYTSAALLYEIVRRSFRQFDDWRIGQIDNFVTLSEHYCAHMDGH